MLLIAAATLLADANIIAINIAAYQGSYHRQI